MKDYHDMLNSLKDKVIDAAGKAGETVTNAANKVVSDEMRDKVAGAAHAVGDRAKYASRMTRMTVDCNAELERVKRTYTEIGRLYYENYRDTADAFLAELCQQVTDANARVDDGDRRAAAGRQEHVRLMAQRREAHFVPAPGAAGRLVPEAGERVVRRDRLIEKAVRHIGVGAQARERALRRRRVGKFEHVLLPRRQMQHAVRAVPVRERGREGDHARGLGRGGAGAESAARRHRLGHRLRQLQRARHLHRHLCGGGRQRQRHRERQREQQGQKSFFHRAPPQVVIGTNHRSRSTLPETPGTVPS